MRKLRINPDFTQDPSKLKKASRLSPEAQDKKEEKSWLTKINNYKHQLFSRRLFEKSVTLVLSLPARQHALFLKTWPLMKGVPIAIRARGEKATEEDVLGYFQDLQTNYVGSSVVSAVFRIDAFAADYEYILVPDKGLTSFVAIRAYKKIRREQV